MPGMDSGAMDFFGPWLGWLFGIGAVLSVAGFAAMQFAGSRHARGVGRGALKVGLRMVLVGMFGYLVILAIENYFSTMLDNLPEA